MIVGLTGGVASGKSVVAKELKRLGAMVIDADRIGHAVIEPGADAYAEVVKEFGPGIVLSGSGGIIDRKALAKIVFSDKERLARLNSITHPRIIGRIKKELDRLSSLAPEPIIVVNAALLIESGHYKEMDVVVLVSATETEQVSRAIARDRVTREQVLKRIAAQMSTKEKAACADRIIENNGTVEELIESARELYSELRFSIKSRDAKT